MYFDIFKTTTSTPQKYWWVAKGNNHETMASSEMLSTKQAAVSSIKTIKGEAANAGIFDETGEAPGTSVAAKRII